MHAVLLFVRRIVFLVDDDQGEAWQRAEHREPRAQHELRGTGRGGVPMRAALAVGKPAVQRHRLCARQRIVHARFELWRQIYFRHEQQHLPAPRDRRTGSGEKNVGLSATRDALKEERREGPGGRTDCIDGRLLIVVQRGFGDGRRWLRRLGSRS